MTAEVAVMNKSAVALAADSAVTIQGPSGDKIYNTVNKLFSLSKYAPVGVMVYGRADFMGIPWETIIKEFREDLGKQRHASLEQYAEKLISFVSSERYSKRTRQFEHFMDLCRGILRHIRTQIDHRVREELHDRKKLSHEVILRITEEVIDSELEAAQKFELLDAPTGSEATDIEGEYEQRVDKVTSEIFEKLPVSAGGKKKIATIVNELLSRQVFPLHPSGIVVAGFGDLDLFPSVRSYLVDGVIRERLRYSHGQRMNIEDDNEAAIIPFAEGRMVSTFMEGVDPEYEAVIESCFEELISKLPRLVTAAIRSSDSGVAIKPDLRIDRLVPDLLSELNKRLRGFRAKNHVNPVLSAVSVLPKDELAEMAESLVNLTSFKQRISMDAETVGGPIDVAVISKGDGLVWIRRKHYFKPELNPGFFETYYLEQNQRFGDNK